MLRLLFVIALCLSRPGLSIAHEFWIEPEKYQVETNEPLSANLVIGQGFEGSLQMFFDTRIERFELRQGHQVAPYAGRMGDIPALTPELSDPGLLVIVHQTQPSSLKYHDWATFQAFIDEKDLGDVRSRHNARGLPKSGFYESYTRFAKALVAIGESQGADRRTGMDIITGAPPLYRRLGPRPAHSALEPRPPLTETQITVFDHAPDGLVSVKRYIGDHSGRAVDHTTPGHSYLLAPVVPRPAPQDSEAVWDTLGASLTFFVGQR